MASPRLPIPLRDLLDEQLRGSDTKRIWSGLEAKRAAASKQPPRSRLWVLAALSALAGALCVLLWMRPAAPPVLHLLDGRDVPPHLEAPAVAFDDGSAIEVEAGARLDLLESTPRAFSLALRNGTADFEVHPGGPRVWQVVCGPVTVEVVGTHFTVVRDSVRVKVSVQRGVVLVRGEPVPDHVVRLGPTQSIVVPLVPLSTATKEESAAPVAPITAAPSSAPAAIHVRPGTSVVGSAVAEITPEKEPAPGIGAMLSSADEARLAGRYHDAAEILERVVAEQGASPQAYLAEFSLGRLYLDALGDPARAAPHLARALSRGLPGALAEDASARLVEAYARAGDANAARDAAGRYSARYPQGRRLADVNRWSGVVP